jgi:mono/diheme cytochrome c family protein
MRRGPGLALGGVTVVALLALEGPGFGTAADAIDPDDPAQVALGERVYAVECASCHGANLEGQPDWQSPGPDGTYPAPPHDATGHTWHHADALLFDYTKRGGAAVIGGNFKSDMPGFGDRLTDEEIRAVLAFIKSTWPARIRRLQEERSGG